MYSEHLDLTTLNDLLKTTQVGRGVAPNEVWEEIDSTNTRAAVIARESGAEKAHGVIVAARRQNAGRGRQGRTWVSPLDAGLYISFLLRPKVALTEIPLISLATGTAVARALLTTCGAVVQLKWVNDIVWNGKKLGGILAEMPQRDALIVGIGINLIEVERPEDLRDRATSMQEVVGQLTNVNQIAASLATEIERAFGLLESRERTQILNEWKERSATLGKEIKALMGNETIIGTAVDIDRSGSLVVRTADGDRTIHAGEVSIRTTDGGYA